MWKRLLARCDEDVGDTVDSRYRGLFAEETGIALMAIVLKYFEGARQRLLGKNNKKR